VITGGASGHKKVPYYAADEGVEGTRKPKRIV